MVYQHYLFDSGTTGEPNPPTFLTPRAPHVAKFKVLSVMIPLTFYTTGPQNNQVAKRENGSVRYVRIPPGNYNAASFPLALQTALGGNYSAHYDDIQRNVRIENSNQSFSILGLQGGTTAFDQLGMTRTGESPVANSFEGGVSNFTGTVSLLLVSTQLMSRDIVLASNEAMNALALIELSGEPGSYIK